MRRRLMLVFFAAMLGLAPCGGGAGSAWAAERVSCDGGTEGGPPDPRCGDRLDGRTAPETPLAATAARVVLWPPRMASRVVFWPVVRTAELVEHHRVPDWLRAILTTDDGLVGVRPEVRYTTGFTPTAGLGFFYRRLPGEGSEIAGRFLTAGPAAMLGELQLSGPAALGLSLRGSWSHRDDRRFAGIGANSEQALAVAGRPIARFGSDVWLTELRWFRHLRYGFGVELATDVQRRDYRATGSRSGPSVADVFGLAPELCASIGQPQGCVDPTHLPGFDRGLRIAHAGGRLSLVRRTAERYGSGVDVAVESRYGHGLGGDPSRHVMTGAEIVVGLGHRDRVLLGRARAAVVEPLGAARVPFEELVTPSGPTGMRGFWEGRFRDHSGVVVSAEYRWFIAYNLDAALFADAGTVAGRRFSGLGGSRWFPSFGLGLRLFDMNARPYWRADLETGIQIAYAPDNGFWTSLSVASF